MNRIGIKTTAKHYRGKSMSYSDSAQPQAMERVKKISWLKTKLRNWVNKNEYEYPQVMAKTSLQSPNRINFRLYKANGGMVVELDHYSDRVGESSSDLHIITDDKKLGDSLEQIITLHLIKL